MGEVVDLEKYRKERRRRQEQEAARRRGRGRPAQPRGVAPCGPGDDQNEGERVEDDPAKS